MKLLSSYGNKKGGDSSPDPGASKHVAQQEHHLLSSNQLEQLPGTTDPVQIRQSAKGVPIMMSKMTKCYIGIDVSKDILDVYVLPNDKYMQFKNKPSDRQKLIKKLTCFGESHIVIEATGGYERAIADELVAKKMPVSVVNPRQVRDFAKALGRLAKTDKIDAQVIALFAEKIEPRPNVKSNDKHKQIADTCIRRRQLINMINMEKNHLEHACKEQQKSIKRVIKMLERELKKNDFAQEEAIKDSPEHMEKFNLLKSINGVGNVVASTVIAHLPELGNVSHRQIAALAGVAPFNRDSGTLKGKRTIWGGRSTVRTSLYMAALVAMRYNEQIKRFYVHLCHSGKPKKVAIVACMRKLLLIMNAMIKSRKPWSLQTQT